MHLNEAKVWFKVKIKVLTWSMWQMFYISKKDDIEIVQAQELYYIFMLFSYIIHSGPGLNRQFDWEQKAVS